MSRFDKTPVLPPLCRRPINTPRNADKTPDPRGENVKRCEKCTKKWPGSFRPPSEFGWDDFLSVSACSDCGKNDGINIGDTPQARPGPTGDISAPKQDMIPINHMPYRHPSPPQKKKKKMHYKIPKISTPRPPRRMLCG